MAIHKSVTVITKVPAKYHIVRYDSKGKAVEDDWATTSFRAQQRAEMLSKNGVIIEEEITIKKKE